MGMYFVTPLPNSHTDGYDEPIFIAGVKKTFFHVNGGHMIDIENN
jgi:hypothetical protein